VAVILIATFVTGAHGGRCGAPWIARERRRGWIEAAEEDAFGRGGDSGDAARLGPAECAGARHAMMGGNAGEVESWGRRRERGAALCHGLGRRGMGAAAGVGRWVVAARWPVRRLEMQRLWLGPRRHPNWVIEPVMGRGY